MTNVTTRPKWFSILAIVALVWNILGIFGFFSTVLMTEEMLAAMPEAEQEMHRNTPLWTNIAFAVAVFAGTLGSLGLVLKRRWAKPLLILSLIGVLVQMSYPLIVANGIEIFGPVRLIMPVMIIGIGIFLIWMANKGEREGWLI